MYFSFWTKGKYLNYILSKWNYSKYILLLAIDTWPTSLAPTMGDLGGSWKHKPHEEKIPFETIPACKNLVSDLKILAEL